MPSLAARQPSSSSRRRAFDGSYAYGFSPAASGFEDELVEFGLSEEETFVPHQSDVIVLHPFLEAKGSHSKWWTGVLRRVVQVLARVVGDEVSPKGRFRDNGKCAHQPERCARRLGAIHGNRL